jgi:hypothetical protein
MTHRQFLRHKCDLPCKGTKIIPVLEILDFSWKKGMKILLATGLDGVDYRIEVQKPIAIPLIVENRRKVTPFKTDEDETEPNCIHEVRSAHSINANCYG